MCVQWALDMHACKCLLVSFLDLITHKLCFAPRAFSSALLAQVVARTAACSKKAISKNPNAVFAQQVSQKSARLRQSHIHVAHVAVFKNRACHASWKSASCAQLMHEQATQSQTRIGRSLLFNTPACRWTCMKGIECVSATHAFPMIRPKTSLVTPGTHERPNSNTRTALPAGHTCVWSCYSCWPCVFSDDILGSTAVSKKIAAERGLSSCMYTQCIAKKDKSANL